MEHIIVSSVIDWWSLVALIWPPWFTRWYKSIICLSTMEFKEENNNICPEHHGFRQWRSCETQFLAWQMNSYTTLRRDYRRTSWSRTSPKPFNQCGIRGKNNTWIKVFWAKQQAIVIDGARSEFVPVESGRSATRFCPGSISFSCMSTTCPNRPAPPADGLLTIQPIITPSPPTRTNIFQQGFDHMAVWEDRWDMSSHPDQVFIMSILLPLSTDCLKCLK